MPAVGQWLFSSCSAEYYGKILAVGKDANGADVIDIRMSNPNNLVSTEDDAALTRIDLPTGVDVILRDVLWKSGGEDGSIVCDTPGSGCYRCTKLFWLRDTPADVHMRRPHAR